jgi:type II secretory pathway component PulC
VLTLADATRGHCKSLGVPSFGPPEHLKFPAIVADEIKENRHFFDKRLLARNISTNAHANSCVILASGSVDIPDGVGDAIILANGNVTIKQSAYYSVIICNAHVEVKGGVERSVVLCRGTMTVGNSPTIRETVIERNERNPLRLFKFFELAHIGLQAEGANRGVRVLGVDKGKPCARAGLQNGDIILAIQDANVNSAEQLRNQLRRQVLEGQATLLVRRGTAEVGIRVSFKD